MELYMWKKIQKIEIADHRRPDGSIFGESIDMTSSRKPRAWNFSSPRAAFLLAKGYNRNLRPLPNRIDRSPCWRSTARRTCVRHRIDSTNGVFKFSSWPSESTDPPSNALDSYDGNEERKLWSWWYNTVFSRPRDRIESNNLYQARFQPVVTVEFEP